MPILSTTVVFEPLYGISATGVPAVSYLNSVSAFLLGLRVRLSPAVFVRVLGLVSVVAVFII